MSNVKMPKTKKEELCTEKTHSADLTMDLPKELKEKNPGEELVVSQLPKKLWVASTAYNSRERVWHQVEGGKLERADRDMDLHLWLADMVCVQVDARRSRRNKCLG